MAGELRLAASVRALRLTQSLAAGRSPIAAPASRLLSARGYRRLATDPRDATGTPTSFRLNALLDAIGGTAYLEIGVWTGLTLESVRAGRRVGVDPAIAFDPAGLPADIELHRTTSDRYFRRRAPLREFDLIFLDGLHEFRQTYRDVVNALAALRPGGAILVDDVVPSSEAAAAATQLEANRLRSPDAEDHGAWMGDVFRVIPVVMAEHPDVTVLTITGDGHRPQSLLIPPEPMAPVPAPEDALAKAEDLTYRAVFAAGIPDEFRPVSVADAVRAVRAA